MKETTKIALLAGGAVATVVGGYFGKKFIANKVFTTAVANAAEAAKESASELSDAAKEVVDEVIDSEE